MLRRWRRSVIFAGALLALAPLAASAAASTLEECVEGADFIANAALSRDNGMARDAYIGRLEGDLVAIRAFPASLRWFVKDLDDERFLRAAAEAVFDRPQPPARHRAAFFASCVMRDGA